MIKGKVQTEWVTVKDILDKTNGGYDVFMHYLGKVQRQMPRPWGRKERKESWGLYPYNGTWFYKDQATEETGNAVQFVQKYSSLTFEEARDRIAWQFGISGKAIPKNPAPIVVSWEQPYQDEGGYMRINFSKQPFKEKHHDYWNKAEVSEKDCAASECWAVKDLAIAGKRVYIGKEEIVFAFYCPEEDAVKIYFPLRDRSNRFRNNVSYRHLWNFSNVGECDNLIIQKSPKDMVVTKMVTPCVIATQAEAVKIFDGETVARINGITKSPWVWYGSDWDGVKKCKEITDTNKWHYINTPKKLLPDVNDVYGFVSHWNDLEPQTGLRKLQDFMTSKKLIV